jgi:hypothetical protein
VPVFSPLLPVPAAPPAEAGALGRLPGLQGMGFSPSAVPGSAEAAGPGPAAVPPAAAWGGHAAALLAAATGGARAPPLFGSPGAGGIAPTSSALDLLAGQELRPLGPLFEPAPTAGSALSDGTGGDAAGAAAGEPRARPPMADPIQNLLQALSMQPGSAARAGASPTQATGGSSGSGAAPAPGSDASCGGGSSA